MFCPHCGTKLPDDSRFCTECGSPIADDERTTVLPQPSPLAPDETAPAVERTTAMPQPTPELKPTDQQEADPKPKRSKTPLIVGIVLLVVLLIAGGSIAWWLYNQHQQQEAWEDAHAELPVRVSIDIQGLDASDGSKIPLSVEGTDLDGESVSTVAFVDETGESLRLKQGTYTVRAAASPIAADGTIYTVPTSSFEIEVEEDTTDCTDAGTLTFEIPDAADVTDEQIENAYTYAKDGGCESEADANDLRSAAIKKRDEALVERKEAEEREKAAAYHIVADSYELDVPSYWRGKVTWQVNGNDITFYSTAYPDREVFNVYWKSDESNVAGSVDRLGGTLLESSSQGVIAYTGPNYAFQIPWALRSGSTAEEDFYTEDEANALIALQSGGTVTYDQTLNEYDANTYDCMEDIASYLSTAFTVSFR